VNGAILGARGGATKAPHALNHFGCFAFSKQHAPRDLDPNEEMNFHTVVADFSLV
jgi:hypothetical protein